MHNTNLEKVFCPFFQQNINFILNDKIIKRGKFLLFKQDGYLIEFNLQCIGSQKSKKYEIPYPFKIEFHPDEQLILFDYRLKTLTSNKNMIDLIRKHHNMINNNKFYDNILELIIAKEE
jgi:hypothetical protein